MATQEDKSMPALDGPEWSGGTDPEEENYKRTLFKDIQVIVIFNDEHIKFSSY